MPLRIVIEHQLKHGEHIIELLHDIRDALQSIASESLSSKDIETEQELEIAVNHLSKLTEQQS